jgi:2,4-dienoyl-CoA reductase-like NADH-dependent reductase (Old Yellow Enzyme family)
MEGGLTPDDALRLARDLKGRGLDFVDISSGGVAVETRNPVTPGYNVPIAARVKRESGIATRTVGLITTPEQAEAIVAEGQADMVALARAFLDNPRWAWAAARRFDAEVERPSQYLRVGPKLWQPPAPAGR